MKINIKKKILSLLLIFMTVVTTMPVTTFESMADITTPEFEDNIAEPLCFTALEDNIKITTKMNYSPGPVTLEYSKDGTSWLPYTMQSEITLTSSGDKLYFRNTEETDQTFSSSDANYHYFAVEGSFSLSGDTTTLLNKNGTDTVPDYAFFALFSNCKGLKSISPGLLPATKLGRACYDSMFMKCSGLESIPAGLLPATTLAKECYQSMFESCEGLTMDGIPNSLFHVTGTLPDKCYDGMFEDCTGIKLSETKTGLYVIPFTVPVSGDATSGTDSLYDMFAGTGGTFKGTPETNKTYYTIKKFTMTPAGKSLSIKDELFVTFCFKLSEEFLDTGKMVFTIDHNGGTQVVDGYMEDGLAKFKCKINVNQMNDAITWEYRIGDQRIRSVDQAKSGDQKYSFYTYLNSATNADNTSKYPDNAALCNKLKAYGYYAQHYLAEAKGNPITHVELKAPPQEPTSHTEDLKKFKLETTGSSTNISSDGITRSLILDSMISMKLYIPLKKTCEWTDGTLPKITVKRDNSELGVVDAKIEGGKLCITTAGIAIRFLERTLTVQIGDEFTIKTTAMSYAQKLSELDSNNAIKLADSLYELCEKANGK